MSFSSHVSLPLLVEECLFACVRKSPSSPFLLNLTFKVLPFLLSPPPLPLPVS